MNDELSAALSGAEIDYTVEEETETQVVDTGENQGEPPAPEPQEEPPLVEDDEPEQASASATMIPKQRLDKVLEKVRIAELERARLEERLKIFESRNAPQVQEAPEPGFDYGDIEGSVKRYLERETNRIREEHQAERLAASVASAKRRYADYDEVFNLVMETSQQPGREWIAQEIMTAPDPAEAMYQKGIELRSLGGARNLSELRENIRKELRSEIEKQLRVELEVQRSGVAKTLASASSAPAPSADDGEALSIRDILGR